MGSPGYNPDMRALTAFMLLVIVVALPVFPADPPLSDGVSGAPIAWSEWVGKRAPVAVLVWASWAPGADQVIADYPEMEKVAEQQNLHLILLDVQESLEDGRAALGPTGIAWLHDLHGAMLKQYRVIRVPSALIVAADGEVVAKTDATAEALAAWRAR